MVAAIATGFAGAVALARRDVGAVLPGVAIAISLVPPLAVVGVCLGDGAPTLALGALLLFLSNLIALVLAGTLVFSALTFTVLSEQTRADHARRKTYLSLALLTLLVAVPLLANTAANLYLSVLRGRAEQTAKQWIEATPAASVSSVDFTGIDLVIGVQTPGSLPPVDELVTDLEGQLPNGVDVVVTTTLGERIEAGTLGGE